ncbi:hypothetical protein [Flavobacterium sp. LM4]|uniref:DUF6913 domain-containing protein n=1 Tax=Flavobacterium sp. LM4 TaxID=1938609 RepID=UPI000991E425|nr:hypothetical protein [Flavobacterium sp. LM4]OOV16351.1 hypothetical protein BXU10_22535 [Flavobacterium sp. LM4]
MFLNYLKDFFIKKTLKNNLLNVKNEAFTSNVQTIGLLIDESDFSYSKALIAELISNKINSDNIKIVVYRNKFDDKKEYAFPTFTKAHIDWYGGTKLAFLTEFIETEFDLLISYYDAQNPILKLITNKSKAKFKVGFASVDKNINRWMINTSLENYKLFVFELFKYLKNIK